MAHTSIPLFSGTVPNRNQAANVFADNADDWLAYQAPLAADYNTLATAVDATAVQVDQQSTSVENATNFNGRWSDLTGPLNVPASVFHNDTFWQLLDNLADVTTSEPSVTSNWAVSTSGKLLDVKNVSTPYLITQDDTGFILVFDDAGTAILNIPDSLSRGTSVMTLNIGGGDVSLVNTGTDTTRGALVLGDITGYLAVTKITPTIWQSSEP